MTDPIKTDVFYLNMHTASGARAEWYAFQDKKANCCFFGKKLTGFSFRLDWDLYLYSHKHMSQEK